MTRKSGIPHRSSAKNPAKPLQPIFMKPYFFQLNKKELQIPSGLR